MSISENMKQITDLASMLAGAVVSLEKKLENNSRLSAQATPREVKCPIIVSSNTIEIYDDYRE
jgi:hypothetical protein